MIRYLTIATTLVSAERCFSSAEWTAPKLNLRWKGNIQITWICCTVINMFCNANIILIKFAMYFVVLFCQNASSVIERVRNSGFEKLSSRTVLEHPEVLLCPSLDTSPLLRLHVHLNTDRHRADYLIRRHFFSRFSRFSTSDGQRRDLPVRKLFESRSVVSLCSFMVLVVVA